MDFLSPLSLVVAAVVTSVVAEVIVVVVAVSVAVTTIKIITVAYVFNDTLSTFLLMFISASEIIALYLFLINACYI